MKTTVLLADEQTAVRQMLALILEKEGAYEVVAEAANGYEALKLCRRWKPRFVIADLLLPELSGLEVVRWLRAEMRETRVLIFSATQHRVLVGQALQARPHGFVCKQDSLGTFREALRAVTAGCVFFTPFATGLRDETRNGAGGRGALTERQRAVLQMIAEGMSNKEMADRLKIAPKTVEHYRAQLMEKLDLHDVARLTRYAVGLGMVPIDP